MTVEANSQNAGAPATAPVIPAVPDTQLEVSANPAPATVPPVAKEEAPIAVAYNPTGDVGLDMTLKFVGDLGYSPEHPAMAAAINGDFTLLEAELASKGVKGYEAYIKLGQKAYADVSTKTKERQAKDRAAVEGIAGGADNWSAMTAWAATNADDSEKASLKAMLGKGGLEAQMAASWLAANYNRANNVSTAGAGTPVSNVRTDAAPSGGALSPKEYGAAVIAARAAHRGGNFETSAAYRQLADRRMAYRG